MLKIISGYGKIQRRGLFNDEWMFRIEENKWSRSPFKIVILT
jgi:hypothetical protein